MAAASQTKELNRLNRAERESSLSMDSKIPRVPNPQVYKSSTPYQKHVGYTTQEGDCRYCNGKEGFSASFVNPGQLPLRIKSGKV